MRNKIYVADDDPAILEVCTIVLEEEGYEVETSVDGRSIQNRETDLPSLVLLDVMMSGTSGDDICFTIKGRASTKHLPVVLISANRNLQEVGNSCGADAILAKPFDISKLVEIAQKFAWNAEISNILDQDLTENENN